MTIANRLSVHRDISRYEEMLLLCLEKIGYTPAVGELDQYKDTPSCKMIADRYHGMGYGQLFCYNPKNNNFTLIVAGGSNYYDEELSYTNYDEIANDNDHRRWRGSIYECLVWAYYTARRGVFTHYEDISDQDISNFNRSWLRKELVPPQEYHDLIRPEVNHIMISLKNDEITLDEALTNIMDMLT